MHAYWITDTNTATPVTVTFSYEPLVSHSSDQKPEELPNETPRARRLRLSRERTRSAVARFLGLACRGWVPQWLRTVRGPVATAPLVVRGRKRRTCSMADRYRVTN